MHLIVCLDDRDGMTFVGRRQSMDRLLRARMLQTVGSAKLWMNSYSARQFEEPTDSISVDEDFLTKAGTEDYCFAENVDITGCLEKIRNVIIYRWGRVYPSDVTFPTQILSAREKIRETAFPGSSHEKITEEVYVL